MSTKDSSTGASGPPSRLSQDAAPGATWRTLTSPPLTLTLTSPPPLDACSDLKLEKSYISFRQSNPNWCGQRSQRGESLIERVGTYREAKGRQRGGSKPGEDGGFFSCLLTHSVHPGLRHGPFSYSQHPYSHSHSHTRMTRSVQLTRSRMGPHDAETKEEGDWDESQQYPGLGPREAEMQRVLLGALRAENIDWENDHYWFNLFCEEQEHATSV